MEIPMNVTIMNACFYRDRHLIQNSNFVSLINEIEQKYAALREKALRLLSKGNRQNPRPMAEAKKVFDEMEETIDKMKRDRNTVTKYMKKIGFQLPSMQDRVRTNMILYGLIYQYILAQFKQAIFRTEIKEPEEFFGPNIGRLYGWTTESNNKSIVEADIIPGSDLSPNDLFYSLYNYEELEKAVTVLQGKATQDDRKGYNIDHQIRYTEG